MMALCLLVIYRIGTSAEVTDPQAAANQQFLIRLTQDISVTQIGRLQKELGIPLLQPMDLSKGRARTLWGNAPGYSKELLDRLRRDERVATLTDIQDETHLHLFDVTPIDVPIDAREVLERVKTLHFATQTQVVKLTNDNLRERAAFGLDLLADKRLIAVRGQVLEPSYAKGGFMWSGDVFSLSQLEKHGIPAQVGTISISTKGNALFGRVTVGGNVYILTNLPTKSTTSDLYAIVKVASRKLPPDHAVASGLRAATLNQSCVPEGRRLPKRAQTENLSCVPDVRTLGTSLPPLQAPRPRAPAAASDERGVIEVAVGVGITRVALSTLDPSDKDFFVQALLDRANDSFLRSGVKLKLSLAGNEARVLEEYVEGTFKSDLGKLINSPDEPFAGIRRWREEVKADVIVIVASPHSACGLGSGVMASAETAFAIVSSDCAITKLSFAHEVGHLLGANHNPEVGDSDRSYRPYGNGYMTQHWRTVMAYDAGCDCARLPLWSNPDIEFGGIQMGTTTKHNNARVINEEGALAVSAFR